MERYLVVVCPDLVLDGEMGREARIFAEVISSVTEFCPVVDPVAQGICALVSRGPARYFGGEKPLAARIQERVLKVPGAGRVWVGIADGLFAASMAAQVQRIIAPGHSASFLSPMPVGIFEMDDLTSLLNRLGIRTLGNFAGLPVESVLARFGPQVAACHRLARGLESELAGMRSPFGEAVGGGVRETDDGGFHQFDFWGGKSQAEERATRAIIEVLAIAGPESVFVAGLKGGRAPTEQFSLSIWSKRDALQSLRSPAPSAPINQPWPGRVPPPPPTTVYRRPPVVELVGDGGSEIKVGSRLDLNDSPARFSVGQGSWQKIASWAGPWTQDMAWWNLRRQRRARIQVVTSTGVAHLLATQTGRWTIEATYD